MIHALKIEPEYFEAIKNREKTFEVRENDRDFSVGDYLALNEYLADTGQYTGRGIIVKVLYVLDDDKYCKFGYVILGIWYLGTVLD